VVTRQLQVERRTEKVRRPKTDVLPLSHARWLRRCAIQIDVYFTYFHHISSQCSNLTVSTVQSMAVHQHCPAYISNMVQSVASSTHRQGLRSSTCPTYVVPTTRTKLGERAFSVSGPVAWNALPANIRRTANSKLFKRLLKRHFFQYRV